MNKIKEIAQKAGFSAETYDIGGGEILVCSGLVKASCHHQFKTYAHGAGLVITNEKTIGYGPGVASKEYIIKL